MDRAGLADFLRRRRARVSTADVGLLPGLRRRTRGLRREEVAQLAGMSPDYYARLEQGRGPRPSEPVLAGVARALRLDDDERDHLFVLAGHAPPAPAVRRRSVRPGVLRLLGSVDSAAAFVISDLGETLAQNGLARALVGDETGRAGLDAYVTWRWFTDPASRALYPAEDQGHHAGAFVADLRAVVARRRGDSDVTALLDALLAASAEFRALWGRHDVAVRRADTKRVVHPTVGLVEVDCEVFLTSEHGQRLVVLTPRAGTDARQTLELLAVLGTQQLSPAGADGA